jgi:hypothetical protein
VALGLGFADPLIGLVITAVILRITWHSLQTVRGGAEPAAGMAAPELAAGQAQLGPGVVQ